jgi:hypothetical protein
MYHHCSHHPNGAVHKYTAQILHAYICERMVAWVARGAYTDMLSSAGTAQVLLPAVPVNSEVLRYDVLHSKFECQIVPERDNAHPGQAPYMQLNQGWVRTSFHTMFDYLRYTTMCMYI